MLVFRIRQLGSVCIGVWGGLNLDTLGISDMGGVLVFRGQGEAWGQKLLLCVLSPLWQWMKVKGGDRWAHNPPKGRGPWGWERTVGVINSPRTTPPPPSNTSQEMSSVSPDVTSPQNRPWGAGQLLSSGHCPFPNTFS